MERYFWYAVAALCAGLLLFFIADGTGSGLDGDGMARLVYLGVLGTVVAAGIFGSGRRLGEVARTLAVWMAIILAFVAGYEYRYELQDVASRVSGGLVPGSPLTVTDSEGRTTVTLSKRADGHFATRVAINGHAVNAMVDTGATTTVLTMADAIRAGFDPQRLSFSIPVSTANGTARAARVVAGELAVGGIVRRSVPLLVAEDGRLDQSLLGMNFIGTLSGFELRGDRLILRD
jgi:aspartyl protease family protein